MNEVQNQRILLLAEAYPDDRKTLAVVRSLGEAGYHLSIASNSFKGRSFHSRFIRQRICIPRTNVGSSGFLIALQELLSGSDYAAVFPTSDNMTYVVSRLKDRLPGPHRLLLPDLDAAAICKDKLLSGNFAAKLGLRVPGTICPRDRDELLHASKALAYPCVLKPRTTAGSIGMSPVATARELLDAYDSLPDLVNSAFDFRRPLVQEMIHGEVHEVCALFNRGKPRAALTQRRLLMYPSRGGPGIYNETTDEPDLKEQAFRLLKALKWHGPAQVEFIRDARSGDSYFLEVNGRFWGTLDLSIAAGMNFPALACRIAIEGDVEPNWNYRVGQRYRWPFPFGLLYAMETGRWVESFRDFLLPRRSTQSDVKLRDPKPLAMEFLHTLQRFTKNRFKTVRSQQAWSEIIAGDATGEK